MGLWVRALLIALCASLMSACQILAMPGGAEPIYVQAEVVAGDGENDPDKFQLLLCQSRDCDKRVRDLIEPLSGDTGNPIATRNQIQHAVLARSTSLCNEFKQSLARNSARNAIVTRAAAHVFAAASRVTKGQHYANVFAGIAGVNTAIGTDIEARYGGNVAIALSGIELARTRIFRQILEHQEQDLVKYPLSRAVNDALRYHSVCNLVEGIEESSAAVESAIGQVGGPPPAVSMPILSVESVNLTDTTLQYSVTLAPASARPVVAQAVTTSYKAAADPNQELQEQVILMPGESLWEKEQSVPANTIKARLILHDVYGAVVGTSSKTAEAEQNNAEQTGNREDSDAGEAREP